MTKDKHEINIANSEIKIFQIKDFQNQIQHCTSEQLNEKNFVFSSSINLQMFCNNSAQFYHNLQVYIDITTYSLTDIHDVKISFKQLKSTLELFALKNSIAEIKVHQ